MVKVTIFLVLGFVVVNFADPMDKTQLVSPVSKEQIEAFKEELEEDTKDGGVTCETYRELCAKTNGDDPNSVCHIMLHAYLCDKLQDFDGVREIISRIEKHHPEAINLAAGHDLDIEPTEENAEFDEDEDDYEDSGEYVEE